MEVQFNPETLFRKYPWYVKAYYSLRYFFRHTLGKHHMNVVKTAFNGDPWDEGYLLELEYAKIKEMREWQKEKDRYVGVEFTVRDMDICLSLLEIMMGKRIPFHIEGKLLSEPTGEEGMYRIVESPDFKCVTDVYVNARNADRFVKNEKVRDFYLRHLDELYVLKARHLYHKIRADREEGWWE
ncbi:MAG: hypothetical protein J6X18_04435 [Bacteroidales bacterium]|nr:hypothetical protein [Bacteroidales bacterium]